MSELNLSGHVAIVTGANHGIGAATASLLASRGAAVLLSYLRLDEDSSPGMPDEYRERRQQEPTEVLSAIRAAGGRAAGIEADLRDGATPPRLFDSAEEAFGRVDILVNNASGWLADSFAPLEAESAIHASEALTAASVDAQHSVDARAGALMIAELAKRHHAAGADWGRIVGLTSGGPRGFPGEVSYGAAKAALDSYTMSAAFELASVGITANIVYPPVTDTGWVTDAVLPENVVRPNVTRRDARTRDAARPGSADPRLGPRSGAVTVAAGRPEPTVRAPGAVARGCSARRAPAAAVAGDAHSR